MGRRSSRRDGADPRLLKPDGLCLVSLLGGTTLSELRASLLEAEQELVGGANPVRHQWPMSVMQAAFSDAPALRCQCADSDRLTITYPDMFRLMADLRGMGEQNALLGRSRAPSRRQLFLRAAEIYLFQVCCAGRTHSGEFRDHHADRLGAA